MISPAAPELPHYVGHETSRSDLKQALRRHAAGLLVELLLWFGPAAVFFQLYVSRYAGPDDAVIPHFMLIATAWLALLSIRIAFYGLFRTGRIIRSFTAALMSCALLCLIAYYCAVLVGLEQWSRVISWSLITSYAPQLGELLEVLGVAPLYVGVIAGAWVLGFGLLWYWCAGADWVVFAVRCFSPVLIPVFAAAGLALVSVRLYAFAAYPPVRVAEPLSLTLFPEQYALSLQSETGRSSGLMERDEAAARASYQPSTRGSRRNVVLIVVDALRADHMGVYGYGRGTTPFLDARKRGSGFAQASDMLSACAESSCGLLAIQHGRYVHELLSSGFTLQEALARHGYQTWMILGGDHTNFYGLRDLYGAVDRYFDGSQAGGRYVNDDQLVVEHAAGLPAWDGQPVMMQYHLMSVHGLGTRREAQRVFKPWLNYYSIPEGRAVIQSRKADPRVTNYYDNGVRSADAVIDELLGILEVKGYLGDAIVVVTADHGELLGEHGEFSHGRTVFQPVLHIPFVMLAYGKQGLKPLQDHRVSSQADIAPTILRELDLPIPATWSGTPLQDPPARGFIHFQQGTEVGVVDLRESGALWKYAIDLRTGEEMAFELERDPGELSNQLANAPSAARAEWRRQTMQAASSVIVHRSTGEGG